LAQKAILIFANNLFDIEKQTNKRKKERKIEGKKERKIEGKKKRKKDRRIERKQTNNQPICFNSFLETSGRNNALRSLFFLSFL